MEEEQGVVGTVVTWTTEPLGEGCSLKIKKGLGAGVGRARSLRIIPKTMGKVPEDKEPKGGNATNK